MNASCTNLSTLLLATLSMGAWPRADGVQSEQEAEAEPVYVQLPTDWEVGERYRIEYEKSRERQQAGKPLVTGGTRTMIDCEVTAREEGSFHFEWTWGASEVLEGTTGAKALEDDPVQSRLLNVNEGVVMEFVTDEYGTPVSLANREDVAAHFQKVIGVVEEVAKEQGLSVAKRRQVFEGVRGLFDEDLLESVALGEPSILYMASGGEYELGVMQEFDDLLPNPFGGEPFPAQASFGLAELSEDGKRATLEWRQVLDPVATRRVMLETFRAMAERMGSEPPEEGDLPTFDVVDEATLVMDVETGWPVSVEHQRSMDTGDTHQVDSKRFRLVPNEGR
jgi:hypothetical protein